MLLARTAPTVVTPDRVDLTLKEGETFSSPDVRETGQVQAYYVEARGEQIIAALDENPPSEMIVHWSRVRG